MTNSALFFENILQTSPNKFQFLVPAVDKNTALKGIGYRGREDFSGSDLVAVSVDDLGVYRDSLTHTRL